MAVTLKATDMRSPFTDKSAQTPTEAFAEAVRQRIDLSDLDPSKYEGTGAPRKRSSSVYQPNTAGGPVRQGLHVAWPDRHV